MWEHVMTHLEEDPLKLADRGRLGDQVPPHRGVPRARRPRRSRTRGSSLLDLAYHDVTRSRSLYYLLERRGQVDRMVDDDEITDAMNTPPQTTRARLRGAFIKRAKERKRDYTVDWVHLKLNDQAQRTVLCKDPFKSRDERVERLIASLCTRRRSCPDAVVPTGRGRRAARERPGLQRVAGRPRRRARAGLRAHPAHGHGRARRSRSS